MLALLVAMVEHGDSPVSSHGRTTGHPRAWRRQHAASAAELKRTDDVLEFSQKLSTKDRECLIVNVAILMAQDGRTKPGTRKKPGRKLRGR